MKNTITGGGMNLIKGVYDIAEEFLNLPVPTRQHVKLNPEKINELVRQMVEDGKVNFYSTEDQEVEEKKNEMAIIVRELTASAINYCYWYGNSNVRPNGANSGGMYDLVDAALAPDDLMIPGIADLSPKRSLKYFEEVYATAIEYLIELLSVQRYPLLEERKRHLLELTENGKAIRFTRYVLLNKNNKNGAQMFEELVKTFTGFASDTFLKRASLFFIQLNRQLGWFPNLMNNIFVPADYQVPNVLCHFKTIEYSNDLAYKIQEGKLVKQGSLMECQIRAATIVVCKQLMDITGWTVADVDTYLWTKRKLPRKKFHLTKTTDY